MKKLSSYAKKIELLQKKIKKENFNAIASIFQKYPKINSLSFDSEQSFFDEDDSTPMFLCGINETDISIADIEDECINEEVKSLLFSLEMKEKDLTDLANYIDQLSELGVLCQLGIGEGMYIDSKQLNKMEKNL